MIDRLQEILTQEYSGIIWTTKVGLSKKPYPFFHLDYFLNGMLANCVSNKILAENKTIVFSTSFGHPFFLAHLEPNPENDINSLDEIMAIAESKKGPFNRILIIGENSETLHRHLESHFKKFTFDLFT